MNFKHIIRELKQDYVIKQANSIKLPYFEPTNQVRKKVIFQGRVQKVGFRIEVYEIAKRLNLTGWVKNRNNKSVEAELQGENEKIIFLINFMKSLKRASVNEVDIKQIPIINEDEDFVIIKDDCREK